ncbi:MAG: hypothetical protein ABFS09_08205 [Thermodesulfobacteriota bacterium]
MVKVGKRIIKEIVGSSRGRIALEFMGAGLSFFRNLCHVFDYACSLPHRDYHALKKCHFGLQPYSQIWFGKGSFVVWREVINEERFLLLSGHKIRQFFLIEMIF